MSLLFRIIYAAHANGTHHKLALDALKFLSIENKRGWERLFLKYAARYVEGSKEPDKGFKDFKNHVLHVRENYWGGAEDKCREWYDDFVASLIAEKWEDAIYSAGVLSHYYTDPIMPFHTGQTEAESYIHRAVEWTVNKTYNDLARQGEQDFKMLMVLKPEDSIDFAAQMVRQGAEVSNRYYSHLIAHYDFDRGVVNPREGYNELGNKVLAELLRYAMRGFAVMLEEGIRASGKNPPPVNLTVETVLSGLQIPVRWVTRKMEDAEDRKLVQAMYDELQATGKVVENLPADDRMIRQLHREEVLGLPDELPEEDELEPQDDEVVELVEDDEPEDDFPLHEEREEKVDRRRFDRHERHDEGGDGSLPSKRPNSGPNYFLMTSDDVVDAPSIGPKTAARLQVLGINTVTDLLETDAEAVAAGLNVGYVTGQTVRDWQDQARLQCEIPRLRGHDAQFLVGCGYRKVEQVVAGNPETMLVDLQAFLMTSEGERLLRVGNEPDLNEVKGWIENAKARGEIAATG